MALQLNFTTEEDVTANYWRVTGLRLNVDTSESFVELSLYRTSSARNNGKKSILQKVYEFSGTDYPFDVVSMDAANSLNIAYEKLKTLPEFAGAADV